jgi:hypothetical protein
MKQFKLMNNVAGWLMFLFALVVYGSTIEQSASFWDCGEFVPACLKLEVVHPPGAPMFIIIGRIFTLFAGSDMTQVPVMINLMSGLASAFAVLFLFWSVTLLARKVLIKSEEDYTLFNKVAIIGAGLIAAAAGTFCDSFWFSAVEGEVYALSIGFLMFVVWAIFKWDSIEDDEYADKWFIMIGFAIGLSLGVHLLSLLALPILGVVYYFKKYKYQHLSFLIAMALSFASVPLIMSFVISGTPSFAAMFDKLFVNSFGLPFYVGAIFSILLILVSLFSVSYFNRKNGYADWQLALIVVVSSLILISSSSFDDASAALASILKLVIVNALIAIPIYMNKNSRVFNTVILSILFLYIGNSSYIMVPIRSVANTPINMNKPQDPYRLLSYLNREQYGDRPLIFGPQFTADNYDIKEVKDEGDITYRNIATGQYETLGKNFKYVWKNGVEVLFPRLGVIMEGEKAEAYRGWFRNWSSTIDYNIVDRSDRDNLVVVDNQPSQDIAQTTADQMNKTQAGGQPRFAVKENLSMADNIAFFVKYQMGFMYFRYLMWNFSGRQNDIQGLYYNDEGRWITGIDGLDKVLRPFGTPQTDQTILPKDEQGNWGHNVFYGIPFLLGIIGAVWLFRKNPSVFTLIFLFWLITGILQIVYLNQPPREPRERDYIFAGSALAFSMWIGFAVIAIADFLNKRMKAGVAGSVVAIAVCALAPFLMGSQGWDDHDRSNRYVARDMATDYLESCAPNAILFTQGDNDTYPLWYAQEVENIRPDIRVINLSLIGVDWYIDQLQFRMNESAPIKLSFKWDQIKSNVRNVVRYNASPLLDQNQYYDIRDIMKFIASEKDENKVIDQNSETKEKVSYLPTRKVFLPVDSAAVSKMDILAKEDLPKMVKRMEWEIPQTTLLKNNLIILDIVANNLWERPIYFAASCSPGEFVGTNSYMQLEGMAYRIVPMLNASGDVNNSPIRTDVMYDRLMNKYKWGNMKDPKVYLDENILRMTYNIRSNYARCAEALAIKGEKDKALKLLNKSMENLPTSRVPLTIYNLSVPDVYYKAGDKVNGKKYALELVNSTKSYLTYYQKLGYDGSNDEVRRSFYILNSMMNIFKANGDEAEAKKTESIMSDFSKVFPMQQEQGG